jgi:hypothetical protein
MSVVSTQEVVDGLDCILRHQDQVCHFLEAIQDISEIPKTVGGFSVRSISDRFFFYCLQHSIIIPDFVNEIFVSSVPVRLPFSQIVLPRSIEIISHRCFSSFSSLTTFTIPSDSRLREFHGFSHCSSLSRIEFPASVEIIDDAFFMCDSLTQVIFPSDSHLRTISGFSYCTSLYRIEFPASVEIIDNAFLMCVLLTEVIFPSNSHLKTIHGFFYCTSLCQIALPASVESMAAFHQCRSLKKVFVQAGSTLKVSEAPEGCIPFIVYEDDGDLKHNRRRVNLGTTGYGISHNAGRSELSQFERWHKATQGGD